jgi:succinate-semialdehyde dehydrogenase/glutarate-semialdehyde dehydrogenase
VTTIESIEPATETVRARFDPHSSADVSAAIAAADAAFHTWREVPMAERAVRMHLLARVLRDRKDSYARLITTEMGKPITEAQAEIEKCARTCDFYADHAAAYLADEPVETNAQASYVAFEPLGVILAVMPWNYPFWQVVRFLAPALMAGNAALLKHAGDR